MKKLIAIVMLVGIWFAWQNVAKNSVACQMECMDQGGGWFYCKQICGD